MSKTLGGCLFVRNAELYDYCYKETITSLCQLCDEVSVVGIPGEDKTIDGLYGLQKRHSNLMITIISEEIWNGVQGKEKLAVFQNIATEGLNTDYQFLCQADEIPHEKSYPFIREAIESSKEAYMVSRINLWRSPYTYLNVPHDRKPCSTQVIRLAKTNYRSIDDGESIDAQCVMDYVDKIKIYHFGYVRKREVMKAKVINMQEAVFGMEHDTKLDGSDLFQPDLWFDPKTDLSIIDEPLPEIMKDWAAQRVYDNP